MVWPKGRKPSQEHVEKIRLANVGRVGKPLTQETKDKIAAAQRARKHGPLSAVHRAAIGRGITGRKLSVESKAKIAAKQRQAWLSDPDHKLKTHTDAARQKRSASLSRVQVGRRMTLEQRENNRLAQVRKWESYSEEEWIGRTSKLRPKSQRFFNTSIERAVVAVLTKHGVPHIHNWRIGRFQVDIYVPEHRLVIECDGDYWHSSPEQRLKDAERDAWFAARDYGVVRLKETDIRRDAETITLRALEGAGILNQDGYIGESTRREIAYATSLGKSIRYLEPMSSQTQHDLATLPETAGTAPLPGEVASQPSSLNAAEISHPTRSGHA